MFSQLLLHTLSINNWALKWKQWAMHLKLNFANHVLHYRIVTTRRIKCTCCHHFPVKLSYKSASYFLKIPITYSTKAEKSNVIKNKTFFSLSQWHCYAYASFGRCNLWITLFPDHSNSGVWRPTAHLLSWQTGTIHDARNFLQRSQCYAETKRPPLG